MRAYIMGWLGAIAVAACGAEPGPPIPDPSSEEPEQAADVGSPGSPGSPGSREEGSPPALDAEPPPAPRLGPPYPIVLVHGMGGFGTLEVGPMDVTYFNGVVEDLTKRGEAVYATLAPPYASTEVRAAAVAEQLDAILERTGKAKVNLVAHSQGGLDARVIASPNGLGYGDRVASVTTIATPHRGSRVADVALGIAGPLPSKLVDDVTGALLSFLQRTAYELKTDPALRAQLVSLSERHMKEVFNPTYVDDPGVDYRSYAGRSNLRTGVLACKGSVYPNQPRKLDAVQVALLPTALFLEGTTFEVNDGIVSVASAKWGTFEQCVPADHMKEVGLLGLPAKTFNHLKLFRDIVERLRDAGH